MIVLFFPGDRGGENGGTIEIDFADAQEGVWAEVKVGGEHLRLFSEHGALGVQKTGKDRAEAHAMAYLRRVANVELPTLVWKKSRSA